MPTVSILMPVYKTADYLKDAVDSMLSQTFEDFELIVLDDCSPDNAQEILDMYTDPRIVRYRGSENQGLAMVLNAGIDMARGKYIARMDSDDISMPTRLETQVKYLESHPDVDLCSCGMQLFGARNDTWIRESDPEKVKITSLFFSPILHASSVWRKDSFENNALRFRQEMVPAEDYDLWCRALAAGLRLVNTPDVLYKYRIRPEQATENTARISAKDMEVKREFANSIFPGLEDSELEAFSMLTHYEDPDDVRKASSVIKKVNSRYGFFDSALLDKQLDKFCKAKFVQNMPDGVSISKLFILGPGYYLRRIGLSKYMAKHWFRINKCASFRMHRHDSNRNGCNTIAFKGTSLSIYGRPSISTGKGKFRVNCKWNEKDPNHSLIVLTEGSTLTVKGSFDIYSGAKIYINNGATLELGSGYINHNLNLSCFNRISIGEGVVISENVTLRDSDNHSIIGGTKPSTAPIVIGDHVWIGKNVTILKGVTVGDGAIIAAGAVVASDIPAGCLAGGVPAKVIRNGVAWK